MGAGASNKKATTSKQDDFAPTVTVPPDIPNNPILSVKNQDGIFLIWVGNVPPPYTKTTLTTKLNEATSSVLICSPDMCISESKSATKKIIFVVLHSNFGENTNGMIRKLSPLGQIEAIYVVDSKEDRARTNLDLVNDSGKVKHFLKVDKKFFETIGENIRTVVKMNIDFNMFDQQKQNTARDLTRNTAAFLWFQLLVYVLKPAGKDAYARNEMIQMCQIYYQQKHDKRELGHIEEFRTGYEKQRAIYWYTREIFLYKLLNRALRTEDIHSLLKFRTFIADLCTQIDNLYREQSQSTIERTTKLYRGQIISRREHEQMVGYIDKLISTNGFFSTTTDRDVAVKFACRPKQHPDLAVILFEITASYDLENTKFVDITGKDNRNRYLSAHPEEKEVLFSLGAAFKINRIDEDSEKFDDISYTVVYMTATDEGFQSVDRYIELSKNDFESDNKKVLVGRLLIDMGQYEESKTYFEGFIKTMENTESADTVECVPFFHNMGRAHACVGEFEQALKLMTRAFKICEKYLQFDGPAIAHVLNSIGVIEGEMGHYPDARRKFEDALKKFESQNSTMSQKNVDLQIAVTQSNIGWINYLEGNYQESQLCHEIALDLRKKHLSAEHSLIADNLNSIGALHHAQGKYSEATKNYQDARKMRENSLPDHHPAIGSSYQAIGSVDFENGRYEDALRHYERAKKIFLATLSANHIHIASSNKTIGSVYLEQGDYDTALQYFENALAISKKKLSATHPAIGECYHYIGMVCERQGDYDKAIEEYNKAFDCTQASLRNEHPSIAKIYTSLANTYMRMKDFEKVEEYLQRAHNIQKGIYLRHHPDLALTFNNLGVLYTYKNDYEQAEKYLKNALAMCKQCFSENHPAVARTKFNLGELYSRTDRYDDAGKNYLEALKIRDETLPPNDISLADIYSQYACLCFKKQDYLKALEYLTKSKAIYERNNSLNNKQHRLDLDRINENIEITKTQRNKKIDIK